jgi:hypothetical protein
MRFFYCLLLVFIIGCNRDDGFKPVYDVPADLQPIVDRFIEEATLRGVTITIDNLIIRYDNSAGNTVCGSCNSESVTDNVQKIISIATNSSCWDDPLELEALIFHELGHCKLGRLHDNTLLPNGDPKSLMVENDVSIYAPCIYPIDNKPCDNSFKRDYYLDELFDQNTPVPPWGE